MCDMLLICYQRIEMLRSNFVSDCLHLFAINDKIWDNRPVFHNLCVKNIFEMLEVNENYLYIFGTFNHYFGLLVSLKLFYNKLLFEKFLMTLLILVLFFVTGGRRDIRWKQWRSGN